MFQMVKQMKAKAKARRMLDLYDILAACLFFFLYSPLAESNALVTRVAPLQEKRRSRSSLRR